MLVSFIPFNIYIAPLQGKLAYSAYTSWLFSRLISAIILRAPTASLVPLPFLNPNWSSPRHPSASALADSLLSELPVRPSKHASAGWWYDTLRILLHSPFSLAVSGQFAKSPLAIFPFCRCSGKARVLPLMPLQYLRRYVVNSLCCFISRPIKRKKYVCAHIGQSGHRLRILTTLINNQKSKTVKDS